MKKLNYAIVFVSDMARSASFYRDVLGLSLRFQSPGWTEFANEGTTIALHKAAPGVVSPGKEEAGTCRLGFQVADVDATHRELSGKGVTCVRPPQDQQFGIRQAVYADPDGLSFTLAQPPSRG